MGFKKSNHQNQPRLSYSKSIAVCLSLFLMGCNSLQENEGTPRESISIDPKEGEVHLYMTDGSAREISYSPSQNKILYSKNNQIFEKDFSNQKERRLTFNLGENHNPNYHPSKNWIVYAGTSDEVIEKMNVEPLMKDLGVSSTQNAERSKNSEAASSEIYLRTGTGSEIKRLTRNKGFDGLPVFSDDGSKIYYVSQFASGSQVISYDLKNNFQKVLVTEKSPIQSLTTSQDLLAWVFVAEGTYTLRIKDLKTNKMILEQTSDLVIKDLSLNAKSQRMLMVSNLEDSNNEDIYFLNLQQKCIARLTFQNAKEKSPAFGPDDMTYFFISDRTQADQIFSAKIREGLPCNPWPEPNKI